MGAGEYLGRSGRANVIYENHFYSLICGPI
jgi:hypothetical protein